MSVYVTYHQHAKTPHPLDWHEAVGWLEHESTTHDYHALRNPCMVNTL